MLTGAGRHVTAVQEAVDVDLLNALVLGHLQQSEKMGDVAVHTAVGQKAHEVQGGAPLLAVGHGLQIGGVLEERAAFNVTADVGQVLEHHAAGADVGVAHLAVAHLPLGQTHVQSGSGQTAAGTLSKNLVQIGGRSVGHSVARSVGRHAKAVHDNQSGRCFHRNKFSLQ